MANSHTDPTGLSEMTVAHDTAENVCEQECLLGYLVHQGIGRLQLRLLHVFENAIHQAFKDHQ